MPSGSKPGRYPHASNRPEPLDWGAARIDTELSEQPTIQATMLDTVGTAYVGLGLIGASKIYAALARRYLDDLRRREALAAHSR